MSDKYIFTEKMDEISGFGGTYEQTCRKMLKTALEWLDKNSDKTFIFSQIENVFGITKAENKVAVELEKIILAAVGSCSSAMFHAVLNHIIFIQKNGWENYVKTMEKRKIH